LSRNTSFFHRKANWRQKRNNINRIKGQNGNWTDDPEEIKTLANDFIKDLYSKDPDTCTEELIDLLHEPITEDINSALCKEFSNEEVSDALFQIGPLKAPGPDGMPGRFFQCNWALIKRRGDWFCQKLLQQWRHPGGTERQCHCPHPKR
jgi:hypothetical protein